MFVCVYRQNCEINRLRYKTFELKRDLPNIEALCREVETTASELTCAKAQEQKQREQAAQLRQEKIKLEQQVAKMELEICKQEAETLKSVAALKAIKEARAFSSNQQVQLTCVFVGASD